MTGAKRVDEATVFAPPAWVPTADGPGILLLDDVNRADDRILRGLMQLLAELRDVLVEAAAEALAHRLHREPRRR